MGLFINNAITDRGRILLADAQMGAIFEATRLVMGSGTMPPSATARSMTSVITPVIELEINKKQRTGDGKAIFGGVYSNANITQNFYFREFALFARVQYADGSFSDEVLYSYGNAGETADLMPAYTAGAAVEKQMDLVTWVGNDVAVNLTVASGLVTSEKIPYDNSDSGLAAENVQQALDVLANGAGASSTLLEITLPAAGWADDKTQTVAAAGILADEKAQMIHVYPAPASKEEYTLCKILCTAQAENALSFAYKTKPSSDLTVCVVYQGVK